MANRRNEDFFVTFGSDAKDFSARLKADLVGAHEEINALNLALKNLDKDVAKRAAGGGAGSGMFSNLARTVDEISKLPGSFKTIANDLGGVITSLQSAVTKLSTVNIKVPRNALQVSPEVVAEAAAAPAATGRRRQATKRQQEADRAAQAVAEQDAVAAEETAKSSKKTSERKAKARKRELEAEAREARQAEQDAESAERRAAAPKSTGPRRFRTPNKGTDGTDVLVERTREELEGFLAKSAERYQELLRKIGSKHTLPANLTQLDEKAYDRAMKDAVKAVLDFQKSAIEILEGTTETARRGASQAAQTPAAAARPAAAPLAGKEAARSIVAGLTAGQLVAAIPQGVLSKLSQAMGLSGRGTADALAKAIAGLKVPAAEANRMTGEQKLASMGIREKPAGVDTVGFSRGLDYKALTKAPITQLEQLARDLGVTVSGTKAQLASKLNDALVKVRAYDHFAGQAAEAAEQLASNTRQNAEQAKAATPPRPAGPPAPAAQPASQQALNQARVQRGLAMSREEINQLPLRDKQELARAAGISAGGNSAQLSKRLNDELDKARVVLAQVQENAAPLAQALVEATVATDAATSSQARAAAAASKLVLGQEEADRALLDLAEKSRRAARQPPSEIDRARGRVTAAQNKINRLQSDLEAGTISGPEVADKIRRQTEIRDSAQDIVNQGRAQQIMQQRSDFETSLAASIAAKQSSSRGFGTKAIQPGLKLVGPEGVASILGAQQLPITEGTNNPATAVRAVIARLRKTIVDTIADDGERAAASSALDALGRKGGIDALLKSSKGFELPDLTEAKAAAKRLEQTTLGSRPGAGLTRGVKDADVIVRALQEVIATETDDVRSAKELLARVTSKKAGAVIPENLRSVIDTGGATMVPGTPVTETRSRRDPTPEFRALVAEMRNSPRRDYNLPAGGGTEGLVHQTAVDMLRNGLAAIVTQHQTRYGQGLAGTLAPGANTGGQILGATGPISRLPMNSGGLRHPQLVQLTPEEARDPKFGTRVSEAFAIEAQHRETASHVALGQALEILKSDPNFSPFQPSSFGLQRPRLARGEQENAADRQKRNEAIRATQPIKAAFAAIDNIVIEVGNEVEKLQRDLREATPENSGAIRAQLENLRESIRALTGLGLDELLPGARERQDVRGVFDARREARETSTRASADLMRRAFNDAAFGVRQVPGTTAKDPLSGISLSSSSGVVIPGRFASREEFEQRFGGNATPEQEAQFAELMDLRKGKAGKRGFRRGGIEGTFLAITRAGQELERALAADDGSAEARTRIETLKKAKAKADATFQTQLDKYIEGYAALFGESRPILPPEEIKARRDEAKSGREALLDPNFKPLNERDEHLVELARAQAQKEALLEQYRVSNLVSEPAANTRGQAGGKALGAPKNLQELLSRAPAQKKTFEETAALAEQAAAQMRFFAAESDGTNDALRKQIAALEKQRNSYKTGGKKYNEATAKINELSAQIVLPIHANVVDELAKSIGALPTGPSDEARLAAQNAISGGQKDGGTSLKEQRLTLASKQAEAASAREKALRDLEDAERQRETYASQKTRRPGTKGIREEDRFEEMGRLISQRDNDPNLSEAGKKVIRDRLEYLNRPTGAQRTVQTKEADKAVEAAKANLARSIENEADLAQQRVAIEARIAEHKAVVDTPKYTLTPEQVAEAQNRALHSQRAAVVAAAETQRNIPLHPLRTAEFGTEALGKAVQHVLGGAAEAAKKAEPAAAATVEQAVEQVVQAAAEAAGAAAAESSINLPKGIGTSELTTAAKEAADKHGESVKILTDAQKLSDHLQGAKQLPDRTVSTLRNRLQRFLGEETGGLNDDGLGKLVDRARGAAGTQARAQNPDLVALGDSINKALVTSGGGGGPIDVRVVSFGSAATGTLNNLRSGAGRKPTPIDEADRANVETTPGRRRATRPAGPPTGNETGVRTPDANEPRAARTRRTPEEVAQAEADAKAKRSESDAALRKAQLAAMPAAAQEAVRNRDAEGAVKAITATGLRLSEAISRVTRQLGLSVDDAAALNEKIVYERGASRKAGRKPELTEDEQRQADAEAKASADERQRRVAAARAQEKATLPKDVQELLTQGRAQDAANLLSKSPGFFPSQAAPIVARQLGLDKDDKNDLRRGIAAYGVQQRAKDQADREAAASTKLVNEALSAESERLGRVATTMPKLTGQTQALVRELQRLMAIESELRKHDQPVPEALTRDIHSLRLRTLGAVETELAGVKTQDQFGRTLQANPKSERDKAIKDMLNVTGPEFTALGREAGAAGLTGIGQGFQAEQSRFNAFFGPTGFFGRIFSTGAHYIVRQFSGTLVFGIGNAISQTFRAALEAQGEFVRISNALEANNADPGAISGLRGQLQSISAELAQPLEGVYQTASNLVGVFDTPSDVAFATRAVEELKLISNGALSAQEGVQSLAAAQEAFPDKFNGAKGFQDLVDLATQLQNVTGVNLEDQLKGMATIGPQAKALGMNATDALLLPGLIAKRTGQSGDSASEQFSRILSSLQSGKGTQALLNAGVSQVAVQSRNFNQIFKELFTAIANGTADKDAIQKLVNVAGPKQARAFQAVLDNPAKTLEAYDAALNSAGAGTRRIEGLMGTLNREMGAFHRNLEAVVTKLIDLGALDAFGAILKGVNLTLTAINGLLGIVDKFQQTNGFTKFLIHSTLLLAGLAAVMKVIGAGMTAFRTRVGTEETAAVAGGVGGAARRGAARRAAEAAFVFGPEGPDRLPSRDAVQGPPLTGRRLRQQQAAARAARAVGAAFDAEEAATAAAVSQVRTKTPRFDSQPFLRGTAGIASQRIAIQEILAAQNQPLLTARAEAEHEARRQAAASKPVVPPAPSVTPKPAPKPAPTTPVPPVSSRPGVIRGLLDAEGNRLPDSDGVTRLEKGDKTVLRSPAATARAAREAAARAAATPPAIDYTRRRSVSPDEVVDEHERRRASLDEDRERRRAAYVPRSEETKAEMRRIHAEREASGYYKTKGVHDAFDPVAEDERLRTHRNRLSANEFTPSVFRQFDSLEQARLAGSPLPHLRDDFQVHPLWAGPRKANLFEEIAQDVMPPGASPQDEALNQRNQREAQKAARAEEKAAQREARDAQKAARNEEKAAQRTARDEERSSRNADRNAARSARMSAINEASALQGGRGGPVSALRSGLAPGRLFGSNLLVGAAGVGARFGESMLGIPRGTSRASQALAEFQTRMQGVERASRMASVASGLLSVAFFALPFIMSAVAARADRHRDAQDVVDSVLPKAPEDKRDENERIEKAAKARKSEAGFTEAILNTYNPMHPKDALANIAGGIVGANEGIINTLFGTDLSFGEKLLNSAPNSAKHKSERADDAFKKLSDLRKRTSERVAAAAGDDKELAKINTEFEQEARGILDGAKLDDSDKIDFATQAESMKKGFGKQAASIAEKANALKGLATYTDDQLAALTAIISQSLSLGEKTRQALGGDIFKQYQTEGLIPEGKDGKLDPLAKAEALLLGVPEYDADTKHSLTENYATKPGDKAGRLDRMKAARDVLTQNLDTFDPAIELAAKNGLDSPEYKAAVKAKTDAITMINQLEADIINEAVGGAKALVQVLQVTGGSTAATQSAMRGVISELREGLKNLEPGTAAYRQQLVDIAAQQRALTEFTTQQVGVDGKASSGTNATALHQSQTNDPLQAAKDAAKIANDNLQAALKNPAGYDDKAINDLRIAAVNANKAVLAQAEGNATAAAQLSIALSESAGDTVGAAKKAEKEARRQYDEAVRRNTGKGDIANKYTAFIKARDARIQAEQNKVTARRNAQERIGDPVETARNDLTDAQDILKKTKGKDVAYWNAVRAVREAQIAYANALQERAHVNAQLAGDITDPLFMARESLRQALEKQAVNKKNNTGDPKQDALDVVAAQQAANQAEFDQTLQDHQTAKDLGKESGAQYLSFLNKQHDILTSQIASMKKGSQGYRQAVDQLNTIDQAIQAANKELEGQWNLGDINVPTPYDMRRIVAAKAAAGGVAGTAPGAAQAATGGGLGPWKGLADTVSQIVNVTINGNDTAQMKAVLEMYLGTQAFNRAPVSNTKV